MLQTNDRSQQQYQFSMMKGAKAEATRQQQITAKLAGIKTINELKQIYRTVDEQNQTLRSDIAGLKSKVDLLLQRQKSKQTQSETASEQSNKELIHQQKELKLQYRIMQEMKKRMQTSQQNRPTQQLNDQYENIINLIKNVDQEIALTAATVLDLKNETSRLQKTLVVETEQVKRNQPKMTEFSQENGQLRRKILSLRKISVEREYESAKVMNSMYTVKTRHSKNEEVFQQLEKKKQVGKTDAKKEVVDVLGLEREVQGLKKEVEKTSLLKLKNEAQLSKRRQQMNLANREGLKRVKQMEERRNRGVRELNKYKRIWEYYLQSKSKNRLTRDYVAMSIQNEEYQEGEPFLRRDFAGVLGGKVRFDDRTVLRENKRSFIVGFYVYETEVAASSKSILTAVRAIYDSAEANSLNHVPLPGQYLSKCKTSKYLLQQGDFIKLFKVKYNSTDNRVIKLQIRSNKNSKYEFGDKRSFNQIAGGENVYGFDISIQEYPVCLFGSYSSLKTHWYLESLGVEINDLPTESK